MVTHATIRFSEVKDSSSSNENCLRERERSDCGFQNGWPIHKIPLYRVAQFFKDTFFLITLTTKKNVYLPKSSCYVYLYIIFLYIIHNLPVI